jgi:meiotic recombination protein SPO11
MSAMPSDSGLCGRKAFDVLAGHNCFEDGKAASKEPPMAQLLASSASSSAMPTKTAPKSGKPATKSLLSVSSRTVLCERIESLVAELIRETSAGRDPAFSLGLQPLFSPPFFTGARDLAGVLKVLRTVYECALEGKTVTQRELYYLCASYFKSQQEAQSSLSRVASLLDLERHELGVLAAARGKVAGLIATRTADGVVVDLSLTGGSASIPGSWAAAGSASSTTVGEDEDEDYGPSAGAGAVSSSAAKSASLPTIVNRGAEFVLVVEKDAIFSRLVEDKIWETVPCVLVTGCGMPCLATRAFLHHLHRKLGDEVPVLVLCDSNPYGLGILLCYAQGSKQDGRRFAVPVGWLGLCKADCEYYDLPLEALQSITAQDEKKAKSLLADAFISEGTSPLAVAIAEECEAFLETREKMEIEGILGKGLGFLSEVYLPDKILKRRDWVDT